MYILVDKKVIKATDENFTAHSMKNMVHDYKVCGNTFKIGNDSVKVSTVFLNIDHGDGIGDPILFETMVFGGEYDGYQERYCTYDEAILGHEKVCDFVDVVRLNRNNTLDNLGI